MIPPKPGGTDEAKGQSRTAAPLESAGHTVTTIPPGSEDTDRLSQDEIFGLLSNERRRWALKYLAETGPETTVSDLAEHIASIENDKPAAALTSTERKRVYVGLHQSHLSKMADSNVIEYNQTNGTITLRPEATQLLTYLRVDRPDANTTEPWWHRLIPAPLLTLWENYRE